MEEWFENLFGGIDTMLTRIGAETHAQVPTTQVLIRRNIPGQPDRMYLPGEWYTTLPPAKAMKTDTWLSIEARVQTIGHYVITWQPDIQNLHHYRNPEPLAELTKLWQANPRLVFEDYAPLFGIKILRVDPPQEGTTKAARDATKWIRESAESLCDVLLATAQNAATIEVTFRTQILENEKLGTLDPELMAVLVAIKDDAIRRFLEKSTR
jgi:hypothetical protein